MAQQAGQSAGSGKSPLGITAFWPSKCTEAPMLWEHWITRFTWGVIAKHSFNPTAFYFDRTLTAAQITDLSEEVNGKNRLEAEQTLISNLYLCLGERGQDELHNRKPHLDLATTRYPRVLDEFENVFRKERNETFETYQLLSRKQRDGETLEEFHSVLIGLAARCSLGALERRVLRDVFIVNMSNKEAQTELCRSTKTPDEVYRIALSYERGDKYAKSYKVSDGGLTAAPAGSLQIKAEPISAIRGGYRRPFQRGGRRFGRSGTGGRGGAADRKCYNCDQSGFTPDHIPKCPARNATCNFCKKTGHYERTCRGRRSANRGRVGTINEDDTDGGIAQDYPEESASFYGSSVGWVTDSKAPAHGWDSDSSTEYVVMSIRRKEETELRVAGANKLVAVVAGGGGIFEKVGKTYHNL